jgi:hypothetical protein
MKDRLYTELRRRFASPAEALRALGLDESLLREGEDMLTVGKLRHLSRHARTARGRQAASLALDAAARVRDELDPQELAEVGETLEDLLEQLSDEEKGVVTYAVRGLIRARHRGIDGGYGSDQPPPFPGRPTVGGEPLPLGSTNWSEKSEAHDRRRRAFASDVATRQRAENSRSFTEMFPDSKRIIVMG